jgi:hypothetical protein
MNWANSKRVVSLRLVWTKRINGVGPSNTSTFPTICPGLAAMGEHAQERDACVHAAFLSERTWKVNLIQQCGRLPTFDFSSIALRDGRILTQQERGNQRADLLEWQAESGYSGRAKSS